MYIREVKGVETLLNERRKYGKQHEHNPEGDRSISDHELTL
nr:MAG TPA: hypothetical protein [Caudoviricetes sp.]